MLKVRFSKKEEIRMGSPYNVCRVRITGDWVPDLPETDWQDIRAFRPDGTAVALVRWDTPGNVPGFRLWIVDAEARTVETSPRFPGCCEKLEWRTDREIAWKAFPGGSGTFTAAKPD